MTHSVLLVLPTHSVVRMAESTLEASSGFSQKDIIRLRGSETASTVHLVDLRLGETAHEGLGVHTILEHPLDPGRCGALTSSPLAPRLQFHSVRLVLGRWLFAWSIEDRLIRSVACQGGGWYAADGTAGCACALSSGCR